MFGTNPVRRQQLGDGQSLVVQSVFYTIQGEGPFAGQPAVFVRLWGCNLRCKFCDTDFESNPEVRKIDDLLDTVRKHQQTALIVLTGGEPLRQNVVPFIHIAETAGYTVQIETAGTLWVPGLDKTSAHVIISPKTPVINRELELLTAKAFKYIVREGQIDYDGFPTHSPQHGAPMTVARPSDPSMTVYLQPMDEQNALLNRNNMRAARDACLRTGHYISLQQHKILEVE